MTVIYDASELGLFGLIFAKKGSLFIMVAKSFTFWVMVVVHVIMLLFNRLKDEDSAAPATSPLSPP